MFDDQYHQKIKPELTPLRQADKTVWQLSLQMENQEFVLSRFSDPTTSRYESGRMFGGRDLEAFLKDRLAFQEWNLSLRFGAIIPNTYRVLGTTSPVGYMTGLEWLYLNHIWGIAFEYDFGIAGIFPEELKKINSGDGAEELPLKEYLPIAFRFHNFSATPLLNLPFYTPRLHVHLIGGLGLFIEQGEVKKKRFEIVRTNIPATYALQVDALSEDYRTLGPRGRLGILLEKGPFHLGFDVLFDFNLPSRGDFQNLDFMRGMLSLTLGYHHL